MIDFEVWTFLLLITMAPLLIYIAYILAEPWIEKHLENNDD